MPDPYSWPDTECLRNRLGITDSTRLAQLEAKIVSIREVEAGETRTVDIAKTGSQFCHWRFVDDQVSAVLAELAGDGHLIGYNRSAFVRQLGAAAGYHLDWSELSKHDNVRACRENLVTADTKLLVSVLDPVVRRI